MALLGNIFGGSAPQQRAGLSTIDMALLGVLAYRTLKGKGRLAEMLGRKEGQTTAQPQSAPRNGGLGGLLNGGLGALGGLFGAQGAGSAISDGLKHLLERFEQNGHGDKARSWISTEPSKPISPPELAQALGEERIEWLMQETGLPRDELLAGLSDRLPDVVDQLTPDGRIPDRQETATRLWH